MFVEPDIVLVGNIHNHRLVFMNHPSGNRNTPASTRGALYQFFLIKKIKVTYDFIGITCNINTLISKDFCVQMAASRACHREFLKFLRPIINGK